MKLTKLASTLVAVSVAAASLLVSSNAQAFSFSTDEDSNGAKLSFSGWARVQTQYYYENKKTENNLTVDSSANKSERDKTYQLSSQFRSSATLTLQTDKQNSLALLYDGTAFNNHERTSNTAVDSKGATTKTWTPRKVSGKEFNFYKWNVTYKNEKVGSFSYGKYNNVAGLYSWSGGYFAVLGMPDALKGSTSSKNTFTYETGSFMPKGWGVSLSASDPNPGRNNYSWRVGYDFNDDTSLQYVGSYEKKTTYAAKTLKHSSRNYQNFHEVNFSSKVAGLTYILLAETYNNRTVTVETGKVSQNKALHFGFATNYSVEAVPGLSLYSYLGHTKEYQKKSPATVTQALLGGVKYSKKFGDVTASVYLEAAKTRQKVYAEGNKVKTKVNDTEFAVLARLLY